MTLSALNMASLRQFNVSATRSPPMTTANGLHHYDIRVIMFNDKCCIALSAESA